ncbi:hypothetical protein SEA_MINIFLAYER_12 [Satellite phage MiniFlayer]|nr:hypothetical protein SEA_MINIFLAYER_12 [Satellite phage MiniFlayer]
MGGNIGGGGGWGPGSEDDGGFLGDVIDFFISDDNLILGEAVEATLIEALKRQCMNEVRSIYANTMQDANPGQQATINQVEPEVLGYIDSDFPEVDSDGVLDITESSAPDGYVGITDTTDMVGEIVDMYAEMAGEDASD